MVELYHDPHELDPNHRVWGRLVRSPTFDEFYKFDGLLGAIYQPAYTVFRLWAPLSVQVELVIYEGQEENSPIKGTFLMHEKVNNGEDTGVFEYILSGNHDGLTYSFRLTSIEGTVISADPYAKGAIVNGMRSVVIDPRSVKITDFERLPSFSDPVDAVIYELHIRDFSIHPNSGITHKGKYLGVIEEGTKTSGGFSTGLDYLKNLGATHIEFLPFYDFATVDETKLDIPQYNWGYDPLNFNVPEGSYSTNPYDPHTRIIELKKMIKGLHDQGLRVIMDVVYNHVHDARVHPFHKTVPGYYFRHQKDGTLANGTGVGNDIASERAMVRKYIVDSIVYWAKEFHLDGFRFDLMGNLDTQTMLEIRAALDTIDTSILTIGEGWNLATTLPLDKKAVQVNAPQLPKVGFFNDVLRDAAKGDVFNEYDPGFINGDPDLETVVLDNLLATATRYAPTMPYLSPQQLVQYVEVHDNLTLFDKLVLTNPSDTKEQRLKRHMMGTSIPLLAQGIPFIHAGQEFLRTKKGVENSYKSPDEINQLDWDQAAQQDRARRFFKRLVALRRKEPLFRMKDFEQIRKHSQAHFAKDGVIIYRLFDLKNDYLIIFNRREEAIDFPLDKMEEFVLLISNQLHGERPPKEKQLLPLSVGVYHRRL